MFKAVCIDLDGTLLTDEKTIPKRSILMLDALIDRGIEVVIATGRHFFMANEFLKPLDRDIVVCTNNGAMTRYKDSGKLINIEYVDNVDFKNIFHSAIDFGINPFIYVDSFVDGFHLLVKDGTPKRSHFDEKHTNNINGSSIKYYSDVNLWNLNTILCVAFLDRLNRIEEFNDNFSINNRVIKNVYTIPDGRGVLEFQSSKADKWIAVDNYLKTKGITPSEIVSFGDEFNDKQLVKNSGMGFAMKNAIPDLKSLTNNITEYTNNEEGVYFELKKIFGNILGE